ncbi:UxaA family hydrolase [Anaerotignum sp.]|uniref:UxaA family hydrolase n=1 Tax=Anaerotignum sp. TaxID=2039241 RepID=UPI0028AB4739|nr:UxaA family hydrolase [Anaerotignum sp.]
MNPILKIHEKDNVGTCLKSICTNETFQVGDLSITAKENIPQYHKVALADIPVHSSIIKYGQVIGLSTQPIYQGEYVHIHNIESTRGRGDKKGDY